MCYMIIRKLLFTLPTEAAHTITLKALTFLTKFIPTQVPNIKPQTICGINFPNPIGLAAGLDKNGDYILPLAKLGFGFIEIGTITPRPQAGNPKPRLFRLPKAESLINRMGFNNKGVDYLIEKVKQANFKGVLGINIGKNFDTDINNAIDDYLICLRKVYPHASYITINISSPNTPGLRDLQYSDYLKRLLINLKQEQLSLQKQSHKYTPLFLKISPDLNSAEIKNIAELLLQHKIDGVIATNTTTDKSAVERHPCGNQQGGLSGKPLTQKSTEVIKELHAVIKNQIPIIGVGGIMSAEDAEEKIKAGANLIQIYTGFIYKGPKLIKNLLNKFIYLSLNEIYGTNDAQ